ncbi:MAG TPA: PilN domain-containing protein [Gammaproteobacteria bacterium]|nr:PilN domain-containing protein [Gammaproteobacteria bacterium]
MAHINLLPWREELRKERQRQFAVVAVGSMILMALIILLVHINIAHLIDEQDSRNRYLQQQIAKVEDQIKEIRTLEQEKQRLLDRMNIIQRLQQNRPEIVHLFYEIASRVPSGVYLTSIKQSGHKLVIQGVAQSNARVSAFMRQLDASDWLSNPQLDVIQTKSKGDERSSDFTLRVQQVSKTQQEAKNAKGKGGRK